MRRLIALVVAGVAVVAVVASDASARAAQPPIHHVYIIVLENENESTTFAAKPPAPYLAKTLRSEGAFVPNYYGTGHESNDNYIAMISGQAPNLDNQTDCQFFNDFAVPATGSYGQQFGPGCVYPASIPTIAGQLQHAGLAWRDYNQSMGADPTRDGGSVCGHPAVDSRDGTQSATPTDQYATRHNPFVYFHSIIDNTTLCDTHVVNLDKLPQDLADPDFPSYTFITPDLCSDGHDATCKNPKRPGGYAGINAFLKLWVPRITGSPAYKRDGGLLIITFDESSGTSESQACCGEIPGPGAMMPGLTGPGGGQVGAVLLSPYIKPGTVSKKSYNHYSMLRSVEDLFGLPHIGYAQLPGETSFGSDIFACAPPRPGVAIERVRVVHGRLTLYSVAASMLTVRAGGRIVTRAMLAPCRSYSFGVPKGHGKLPVRAGTQKVTVGY